MGRGTKIAVGVVLLCCGVGVGVLIGWFSSSSSNRKVPEAFKIWQEALAESSGEKISKFLIDELKADNIKENLRYLTSKPHLAGTPADLEQAEYVRDRWLEDGLDSANVIPYKVLLSYPNIDKPNYVYVLNDNGSVLFQSARDEAPLEKGDLLPGTVPPFNAYAANGTVEGDLVYVNYGRIEDFHKLTEELNISLTGKIAIARYGKIFRGNKAKHAADFGAKGLIIYSDPADYAVDNDLAVYPDTWYLPGTGVQRGTLFQGFGGDPLSPGYPAYDTAYKIPEESAGLPSIPVHPIGYDDAKQILQWLGGDPMPEEWKGNIQGLTYKLGPGFTEGKTVKLEVNTRNEERLIHNTVGVIRGSLEPDRYVIAGNHRDAWVYGAVDASSGTAALLEMSRAMGKLVKAGKWRPRRSIVFCSWGAEEFALIGSTEWVEEFVKNLGNRAVAYLNVDSAINGNHTLRLKATPNLKEAVFTATKKVPDAPFEGHSETVYDTWLARAPSAGNPNEPRVSNIGSGSDYAGFMAQIGVPCVDFRYTFDWSTGLSSYPLYHSMYETFFMVSEIMDPSFEYILAVARVWTELARNLADSLILPINAVDTAAKITDSVRNLKNKYKAAMAAAEISWDQVVSAANDFADAARALHDKIESINKDQIDPFIIRRVNDQLFQFERAFTDPLGLPGRILQRHVLFAPSSKDVYTGDAFPGIIDLMFDIEHDEGGGTTEQWEAVRQHMSVVAFILRSAASTLKEVDILHREL